MGIKLQGVDKTYTIYRKPHDRLLEWITRKPRSREHHALADVSIEVLRGETFGLVGENGAGKSTLLKIAAGTIRPTKGNITRLGRVAALLELGAGFHPEETGQDNIRFMGALYGLSGYEMAQFIDHTIKFSELSTEALSRPVKTYSSGMFMRLAFSAATAIEPEILIVDEALSVGDMHFQKKSLNRILELRDRGATILFCSHNLYQVRSLCQRAAWIHGGQVRAMGDTEEVVTAYEAHERRRVASLSDISSSNTPPTNLPSGVPEVTTALLAKILSLTIETADGVNPRQIETFQQLTLDIEVESYGSGSFHVLFAIVRPDKENVFGSSTQFRPGGKCLSGFGVHHIRVKFPTLPLLSGEYLWSVYILDDTGIQVIDMAELINPFTVLSQNHREFGVAWIEHEWL